MGLFDNFVIDCPHCGKSDVIQTKAMPDPYLETYTNDDLPNEIAVELHGEVMPCNHCQKEYVLIAMPKYEMRAFPLAPTAGGR